MGMDLFGKNAKNKQGDYFRANIWYWRPLWAMIENLYPQYANKVESAYTNDGSGLNHKDSLALSKLINRDLENGSIKKYIEDYTSHINSLPQEDCDYCNQTGFRTWNENGVEVQKSCNVCHGELKVNSFATNYPMDYDLVVTFQAFLENCRGFQIW
jgi:hypothetical protein